MAGGGHVLACFAIWLCVLAAGASAFPFTYPSAFPFAGTPVPSVDRSTTPLSPVVPSPTSPVMPTTPPPASTFQGTPSGQGGQGTPSGQGGQGTPSGQGGQGTPSGQGGQGTPSGQGGQGTPSGQGGQGTPSGQGGQGSPSSQGGQGTPSGQGGVGVVGSKVWCIAKPSADEQTLVANIAYACEEGGIDCSGIQPGGGCFTPKSLISHASFVMNMYYQKNERNWWTCHFNNTGLVVFADPSFGECIYSPQ